MDSKNKTYQESSKHHHCVNCGNYFLCKGCYRRIEGEGKWKCTCSPSATYKGGITLHCCNLNCFLLATTNGKIPSQLT